MKFITMRELRNQTSQVIDELENETGVVTSNGKPVGVLLGVNDDFEDLIRVVRQARSAAAVSKMRAGAREAGAADLDSRQIDEEIRLARGA